MLDNPGLSISLYLMKDLRHSHPAILALHPRSSVADVTKACFEAKILWGNGYVKDDEFELAFKSINTIKKLKAFCKELNKDRLNYDNGWYKKYPCQRVASILQWSKDKFWHKYVPAILADNRRIHCSCHEVGSYALRKN